jgi:protein ImuB
LWIDITGVAHLYGGEARLMEDLCARLSRFNLTACAALADTLGAAHALARFGAGACTTNSPPPGGEGLGVGGTTKSNAAGVAPSSPPHPRPKGRGEEIVAARLADKAAARTSAAWIIAPAGKTEAWLARLPVEGLRLAPETVLLLKRLGLKRIGQLYHLPRAALERRFRSSQTADAVLHRLDEALGIVAEPAPALAEPPALIVQRPFADPLISPEGLEAETGRLAQELCAHLDERGLGVRRLCLSLYRADGTVAQARAGLSFACRAPAHLMGLLQEKLQHLDAGFGVDALALSALHVERISAEQRALASRLNAPFRGEPAELVDRLVNRLGAARVLRLEPRESHIPERAQAYVPAIAGVQPAHAPSPWPLAGPPPRPPLLLTMPEPIRVVAEVPEGPPARFIWRRVEHCIVRAEGPERIAPEWWREIGARESRTRDYYRIEDEGGAGYWVFREGLYGAEEEPRWFLHGLYA